MEQLKCQFSCNAWTVKLNKLKGPWTPKLTYHFPKRAQFSENLTVISALSVSSTQRNLHLKSTIYENDAENETLC